MEKNDVGRPSIYTEELATKICDQISTSNQGLAKICKSLEISVSIVYKWLSENEAFLERYTRAREAQADYLADEMLEIADDTDGDDEAFVGINRIQRAKIQIDTRKFIASKLKPKKYGDKIDVTTGGEKINTSLDNLSVEEVKTLLELQKKATNKPE